MEREVAACLHAALDTADMIPPDVLDEPSARLYWLIDRIEGLERGCSRHDIELTLPMVDGAIDDYKGEPGEDAMATVLYVSHMGRCLRLAIDAFGDQSRIA